MSISLVGVVFVQKTTRDFLENRLSFLVSFSAGVFLITAGAIGLEVFSVATSPWLGAGLIILGYLLASGIHFVLPETHHHHDKDCHKKHHGAKRLIIGDSLHNAADGVVLITAFGASATLGFAVAVSIIIHEALQEISEFFVLKQAGFSTMKALFINFLSSSTILVGVLIGYYALASETVEMVLLAVSVGFFLHVVIHDLLPKRSHHETSSQFFKHMLWVLLGVILMFSVSTFLSESHNHSESNLTESSLDNEY
ncbi:MAG: ZIP family metal transporter [Candidatus Nomurabacteria bacterium]|nr:MAG: ZIP family metal transporter [Candidatus Nomurabacteria bacterium]